MRKTYHRLKLELLLPSFISYGQGYALDVGCKDQRYRKLIELKGYEYVGLDITSKGKNTVIADAHYVPFRENSFSLILCTETIEHLTDPFEALREMSRTLNDDGVLILSAPYAFPSKHGDYYRFSDHGLIEICSRTGLNVLEIKPIASIFTVFAMIIYNGLFLPFLRRFRPLKLLNGIIYRIGFLMSRLDRYAPAKLPTGYILEVRK